MKVKMGLARIAEVPAQPQDVLRRARRQLLKLAQRADELYVSQSPHEQRRLLNVVVSNCTLKDGTVEYSLRKPFDLLAGISESNNWRRRRDSNPW